MARPLSANEARKERQLAVTDMIATLRLEEMSLDPDDLALYQQFVDGTLSEQTLYAALDAIGEKRFGSRGPRSAQLPPESAKSP